jgi:hypothetical protein
MLGRDSFGQATRPRLFSFRYFNPNARSRTDLLEGCRRIQDALGSQVMAHIALSASRPCLMYRLLLIMRAVYAP